MSKIYQIVKPLATMNSTAKIAAGGELYKVKGNTNFGTAGAIIDLGGKKKYILTAKHVIYTRRRPIYFSAKGSDSFVVGYSRSNGHKIKLDIGLVSIKKKFFGQIQKGVLHYGTLSNDRAYDVQPKDKVNKYGAITHGTTGIVHSTYCRRKKIATHFLKRKL